MKVKIAYYLNWGKYQGEENTLIGSTLSSSSCCSTPVFFLQLQSSVLGFQLLESDAFENRWNLIKNSEIFLMLWT